MTKREEQISAIGAKEFAALEAKHGDLRTLQIGDHLFAIRCPKEDEFDHFQAAAGASDKLESSRGIKVLARAVTVFPDPASVESIFVKRPMVKSLIASAAIEFAGGDLKVTVGKD